MEFEYDSPNWAAVGTEPPTALKQGGFLEGYKPPAVYFNWFWTQVSNCITELQEKNITSVGEGENSVTLNNVIVNTFPSNTATGNLSISGGYDATASNSNSVALGLSVTASGESSFATNTVTTASGDSSFASGVNTLSQGTASATLNYQTVANNYQTVAGRYNTAYAGATGPSDTSGTIFIVGNGTSASARSNALRITTAGQCMGTTFFASSGADFAEMFEWSDGNLNNDDRRGLFVTFDNDDKIRPANANDTYILGIVSATPTVIGDMHSEEWKNKYKKDVFGEKIVETVEIEESTDEQGTVIPKHTEKRWVLNPEYDADEEYIGRQDRKEWCAVGLKGKLIVTDDGTCNSGDYCKPTDSGTATKSETPTNFYVMKRLDDNHIRVFVK